MTRRLRIVSVCRVLPTVSDPTAGQFVRNRLSALREKADLHALQPVPFCPVVRPLPEWARAPASASWVEIAPMFYLPGVLKRFDGQWLARSIMGRIAERQRAGEIDLIDAHFGYPDGVGAVAVAQRLHIPAFVTIRGVEVDWLRRQGVREQLVAALNAAAGCISVSHSLRDAVVAAGVPAEKLVVIPNAIDSARFQPGDQASARRRLGLADDVRLVVTVGHLLKVKRHDELIRAVSALKPSLPNLVLAIVGGASHEPYEPERLLALARELGVADQVRFVGRVPQDQVVEWLRAADVFALASEREGCCNAVLEALAVGVPVVATAAGDNAHFVAGGSNGYIVPVAQPDDIAPALNAALGRSDWNRAAIAAEIGQRVGGWERVARSVLDFFHERLSYGARLASTGSRVLAKPV